MECLGGNGYVEESGMPRLYREAPLMGIWEGSGNVSALDTLRAMATRPECVDVLFDELGQDHRPGPAAGRPRRRRCEPQLDDIETIQYRARKVAEDICLALQGSLLVRHGHPAVAEAFLATRLGGQWGGAFGTMPTGAGPRRRSSSGRWSRDDLQARSEGGSRMTHAIRPVDFDNLKTMTYEVTDRVARITFNRPEKGNAIIADTPLELSALVERADLDPASTSSWCPVAARGSAPDSICPPTPRARRRRAVAALCKDTVLSGKTQAINHLPDQPWDPMIDYQMMSRFVRGFSSLMHADKPTVVKIHGYCVAGGTDIALHADQVIAASDAKIGYPPMRVWGVPAAGLWAHRLGDQRAKRLLFTGDCISGAQAAEWGLAVEAPEPEDLDERTERLVERIAAMPVNQLIMVKLALNTALLQQGVATSRMVSTVFDGVARHTPEGHAFVAEAREHGFREAVKAPRRTVRRRRPQDVRGREPDGRPKRSRRMTARSVVLSVLLGAHPAWAIGERTDQAHSGFRHQGTDAAGRADPDGRRRGPGAIRRRLSAVRPAAGPPAPPGRRHRPAAAVDGTARWTTLVITSVGIDARTRAGAANHVAAERFGELREGVWMRPDNLEAGAARRRAVRGCACCSARDDDPAELAAQLWDLPGWARTGQATARRHGRRHRHSRADSSRPQRWCATCSPIRCCPTNCCPRTGRDALRPAYHDFADGTGARRDDRTDGGAMTKRRHTNGRGGEVVCESSATAR